MDKEPNPEGLNPFGKVLQELMDSRGIGPAELAARMRETSMGPAITEEDIVAIMTAEPGEEFRRVDYDLEGRLSTRELKPGGRAGVLS